MGETQNAIYLFPSFEEMNNALSNWLGDLFEETEDLMILQIDVPEDFPICRPLDGTGIAFYEVHCFCDIPEKYITAFYDEKYSRIKKRNQKDPQKGLQQKGSLR